MPTKEIIEITIDKTGTKVTTKVKGVKGKSCVDVSAFIEEGLKSATEEQTFTSEYREEKPKQQLTTLGRK